MAPPSLVMGGDDGVDEDEAYIAEFDAAIDDEEDQDDAQGRVQHLAINNVNKAAKLTSA